MTVIGDIIYIMVQWWRSEITFIFDGIENYLETLTEVKWLRGFRLMWFN